MKKYIFTEGKGTYGSNAKSTTSDSFVMIEDTSFLEGFTLPWNSITNKPTAFPPTAHEHSASEITSGTLSYARLPFSSTNVNNWNTAYSWGNHANQGYLKTVSWGIITGKPTSFPPSSHTHTWSEITGKPTLAPSDAEKNVQSNWNETNTNSDAFIRNKPNLNFLPLAGGAFDTDSQLTFPTGNTDLDFLRVRYNNGDTLGFFWRYTGTQTGNENGLELHTSTNLAYRLTQDGIFNFNKTPYVGTNEIYHEGNLTNLSQLNNDLNFISEVSWNNVLNKPSTFPPSSHTHPISQITNLQTALDGKSDINHTHSWSQITSKPSTFTPSAHTHPISQITNLQSTLNNKANTSDLPTKVSQLENDSGYSSRNLAIGASLKSGWGVYAGPNNVLQIIDNLPTPIVRVDNIVGGRVGVHIVDPYRLMELENGERYTIQFEARGNCNLNYIYLMSVSDANQSLPVGGVVREEWETFKATFTKSSNINSQYYYLMFSTSSDSVEGEWFELKNVKMVKGESDIQSYSPAPEDKAGIDHKHIWNDISDNTTNSAGGLRHTTQYGYIDFGPLNSSYGHIHTDRPNFYFNKPLYSIGEKIATEPWANSKFLTTETDPTVPSHVKSITTTEKSNWNTAYNWGNHANAGYALASRTITAGTGLTGGGSLAGNRTINFDTTWGDNRYALQNGNYASLRARGTTKADVGLGNVPNWSGSTSTSLGTSNTVIPSQGAVKAYVDNVRSQILGGSPAALDTLYELAAALGNDPNFSTTVMNEIGTKVPQTRTITAGTGLTGGGNLTANRTISFDTTWGDSRYAGKSHTHSISDITNLQSTLNNKANTSDLPTKVSELENDSPNNIDFVNLGSTTTLYARSEYYSGKLRMATSGGSTTVIDDTENGASLGFVNKFSRGWTSNINLNASAGIFQGTYDLYIRARGSTSLPWGIYNSTKAATHNIDFRPTSAVPLTEEYQEHYMGRVTFSSEDIRDRVYTWFSSSGYDDDEFFVDYVKIVPVPEFNHKVTVDGNEVYHPGNLNPVTLDTPQTLTEGKKIHKLVDGGVFNALELRNPSYGNANSSSVELNIGVSNSSVKERLAGIAAYGIGSYGDTVRLSLGVRNRETELPETLTVNRNGNVGIDKTTPAEKLDVGGNIRASGTILADTDKEVWHKGNLNPVTTSRTITAGTGLSGGGNLGANRTISFDTSWGDGRYVGKSGDTMTGTLEVISNTTHTSPDTLNPNGASIRLFNDLTTDNAGEGPYITFENRYLGSGRTTRAAIKGGTSISGNTANGFIAFYTDSSTANSMDERMRIDHAGNVGIGTASPTQKLDVNGIIKATGGNSTQWNTAYGWGNHATQGYLKSYTDTKYSAGTGLSLSGTTFNITNPFNPSGTYSGLRAQATTKADVGLSNVDNWTSHVTATCDGGWVTLLEMSASRRYVEMQIFDAQSGRHNMSHLLVTRTYGGLSVNVLSSNGHSNRYQEFRILQESGDKIYGNAILQVRLSSSAELRVRTKETGSISGWNNTPPITPFNEDIRTGYSVIETISNIDSSAGSMGTTGVLSAGRGIFTGGNIEAEGNITTSGFSRVGSSNSYVLLGGGSHKSLSDFAMASGTYSGLRAQATTKADVGLGNVPNWSSSTFDSRYVNSSGDTMTGKLTISSSTYQDHLELVRGSIKFELAPSTGNSGELRFLATNATRYIFDKKIVAPSFEESSLREFKENIRAFKGSGLKLTNSLNIVEFDRKDSDIKDKIGIIADDSPKEFLNKEETAVDLYNTIFIQAKAMQELTHENNVLKEKIETLEDRLNRLEKLMKDK